MIDKILKKNGFNEIPAQYKKNIFLGFYFFFFLAILILILFVRTDCECENCKITDAKFNNYSFELSMISNDKNLTLKGKIYNNQILFDKKEGDVTTKYYFYYSDLYVFQDNKWSLIKDGIGDGFDLKYLYKDYVEYLKKNSIIENNEEDKEVYYNLKINSTIKYSYDEAKDIKNYTILNDNVTYDIKYSDFNNITEFSESIF